MPAAAVGASPAPAINPAGGAPGLPPGTQSAPATQAQAGYGSAIQSLNAALANSNNIYSGAQAGLKSQLQQNQGQVQQNTVNQGLGNSTVATTLQQAPLQTYNQGMLNLANAQQQANTQQYDQLANTYSNAGSTEAQLQAQAAQLANALQLSPGLISQNDMKQGQAAAITGVGPGPSPNLAG
jgi:hypothetical protein